MLRQATSHLILAALLVFMGLSLFLTGCPAPKKSTGTPSENMTAPATAAQNATAAASADDKVKVTAYINVTSGCQAETVELLNKLGMDNSALVDMEIVDFGSPEGEQRWRKDGLDCLTILFNGSPAVKFPGYDGVERTVVFFMPAGMSWTHDDLQETFAAIKAKKLQILTENEARQEMAPKSVELNVTTRERGSSADVLINRKRIFEIKAKQGDKTAAQRAAEAKAVLEQWGAKPVDASELSMAPKNEDYLIVAGGTLAITVTPADARAARAKDPKELATLWMKELKKAAIQAPVKK